MNILDIIEKKENGEILSKEDIKYVINGYLDGSIEDYQMSAFLTEIDLLNLSFDETLNLTDVMLNSGDKLTLDVDNLADKHSTGGVGDKTTLVLLPLVASLGVNVAKMSGRGLGHTGGTIDKLESIKGFNTSMSFKDFEGQIKKIGVALTGQMKNLVPADKKIYALRDVSGTVDSIPLIASSIMSKKLASGSNNIVIDLKVGSGALVNSVDEARRLGKLMVKIGKKYGKSTICLLTNMDEPLGYAVGNKLEVIESVNTLKGDGPEDLEKLVIELSSLMIYPFKGISISEAREMSYENLKNGKAYQKFKEWIQMQGGDLSSLKIRGNVMEVRSLKNGYIKKIDALSIGKLAHKLGAGRLKKEDVINYDVGIVLKFKVGDYVKKGDVLLTIIYDKNKLSDEEVLECFEISEEKVLPQKLIIDIIK